MLDDAKNVVTAARKYQKQFAAADKGKKVVRVGPAFLNSVAANIALFEKVRGDVVVGKTTKESATAVEVRARGPVYETIIDIRDDVATTHRGNTAVAKAFGMGARIDRNSTPGLLKVAGDILSVVKGDKALAKAADEAGVNASRLAQLKKAYDALAKAQEGQVSAISKARTGAVDRKTLHKSINGDVAFIRKVATVVFRKDPKVLKEFETVRPKLSASKAKPPAPSSTPSKS